MELEEIEEILASLRRAWTWSLRRAWTWSLKGRLKESLGLELGAWSLDLECKRGRNWINSFLFFFHIYVET